MSVRPHRFQFRGCNCGDLTVQSCSSRNVKQYPDAEQVDGILIVRLDAPLYFANTRFIRERLRSYYRKAQARSVLECCR